MTLSDLLQPLHDHFTKEARAYAKQAGIAEGSDPSEASPDQIGSACSSASYRVAAHEVKKIIKKHGSRTIS